MHNVEPSGAHGSRTEFLKYVVMFDEPAFLRRYHDLQRCLNRFYNECDTTYTHTHAKAESTLDALYRISGATPPEQASNKNLAARITHVVAPLLSQDHTHTNPLLLRQAAELRSVTAAAILDWEGYIRGIDLSEVNSKIRDYNAFYVIEKSCAFESEYIGHAGFCPQELITRETIRLRYSVLTSLQWLEPQAGGGSMLARIAKLWSG